MTDASDNISRVANADYRHSHSLPDQPWWDNLESNFHQFPNDFELDIKTKLMVNSTVIPDIALRAIGASLITTFCLPTSVAALRKSQYKEESNLYKEFANSGDAEKFFKKPKKSITVTERKTKHPFFKPEKGVCTALSFESPFEPHNTLFAPQYLKHKENRTAHAQHWRHDGSPRPTICVIHGFMADAYAFNGKFLALQWFYKQGYDVLLYTLPFHGQRQGPRSPFSGHGYFSGGFSQLNEAVANSIHDLRIFLDYLEDNGANQFGVTGISLGGYTTAALTTVEDRLSFAIPNVPVISMPDLFLEWKPLGTALKGIMKLYDIDTREFRHLLAAHNPLTYNPKLPKERLMIIAGAGDRLAPPKHSRLLWEHWDRCHIHWFPGNHLIHLDKGRYLKEMLSFMRGIEF